MNPAKARAYRSEPKLFEYNSRDAIVFALGVGATARTDLHFLYESHENFQVFPAFVINAGLRTLELSDTPGIAFNLQHILHGEQYIELLEPLPDEAELRCQGYVLDVLDKGKSAAILCNVDVFNNKTNRKLAMLQISTIQVGAGNFNGPRSNANEIVAVPVPQRTPDHVSEEKTSVDQAVLYRLGSMDLNPLHVDPAFARMGGFKQPILHGMCTLGFSTRAILRDYGNNDARNFKAVKARFSAPVVPGQTLVVEMWRGRNNRVHFQTKVKETGKVVIANSYVDFHSVHLPKL